MRTKIAISTIGLLITLSGCGGGETATGSTTTSGAGGHGGGAVTTATTGSGGSGGATAASGTGGNATTSTGSVNPGAGLFGEPCTKNGDCASLLCADTDPGHAVCTKPCANDAECPPAPEWSCATNAGSQLVCLCQPSGEEICDGQDNNCNGVVDEGDCPELFGTASGPIADMKLAGDKLALLTDKTIETLALAGGSPVKTLKSDVMGVLAIATNTTSIFWVQGTMHQMSFTGLAQPDLTIKGSAPYSDIAVDDTIQLYHDVNSIWRSPPISHLGAPLPGPMVLIKNKVFWGSGTGVFRCDVSELNPVLQVTIATNQLGPLLLASDGNAAYWAGAAGTIRKVAPPSYTSITDLLTGEPGITGLAADATNVYWATSDSLTSTLWKLPLAGGGKAKLGGVTGVARHLIPSNNHLYFETGKVVWRSPT